MAELTEFERGVIIGGWLFEHSEREIEAKTGHPKSTVHDTIERYNETCGGTSRPRSGRPPILTDRDRRHIVKIVRSNRQHSARQIITTLFSHLELLPVYQQLKELCTKQAIIVELL